MIFLGLCTFQDIGRKRSVELSGECIEVVSLTCGLVGGDAIQSSMAESIMPLYRKSEMIVGGMEF